MTLTTTDLRAAADRLIAAAATPRQCDPVRVDRDTLTLGYAGVYSSLLSHAERAAQHHGLDVRDILIEVGRRGMVGGQEDMIGDVALDLLSVGTRISHVCAAQRPDLQRTPLHCDALPQSDCAHGLDPRSRTARTP